jgi:hypothetical protein
MVTPDDAMEHMDRVVIAVTAAQRDPQRQGHHIDAALTATGDLQRALILCRLDYDHNQIRRTKA